MILTPMATDAVCELVNIGIGHAASALADLVDCPIEIDIPSIELTDNGLDDLHAPKGGTDYSMVLQSYGGHLNGTAILVIPTPSATQLVAMLLGEEEDAVLDTETRTTLTEVGNILINSLVGMMVNAVDRTVDIHLPVYVRGGQDALTAAVPPGHHSGISVTVTFGIRDHAVEGRFLLVSTPESMNALLADLGVDEE